MLNKILPVLQLKLLPCWSLQSFLYHFTFYFPSVVYRPKLNSQFQHSGHSTPSYYCYCMVSVATHIKICLLFWNWLLTSPKQSLYFILPPTIAHPAHSPTEGMSRLWIWSIHSFLTFVNLSFIKVFPTNNTDPQCF